MAAAVGARKPRQASTANVHRRRERHAGSRAGQSRRHNATQMNRFNIEPIRIPAPVSPVTGIPLAAAADADAAMPMSGGGGFGVAAQGLRGPAETKAEAKALARQRDFERLSAALANSEIQYEDLTVLAHIGQGSAGVVQKVRLCGRPTCPGGGQEGRWEAGAVRDRWRHAQRMAGHSRYRPEPVEAIAT